MLLKFNINYFTNFGEGVFININGKNHAMQYTHSGNWTAEISEVEDTAIQYYYLLANTDGNEITREWGSPRKVDLIPSMDFYDIYDIWMDLNNMRPFYSSAFTKVINRRKKLKEKEKLFEQVLEFRVSAPLIPPKYSLAIVGSQDALGNWVKPVEFFDGNFPVWKLKLDASKLIFPFEFKFVLLDTKTKEIVEWEAGDNRWFAYNNFAEHEYKIYNFESALRGGKPWRGAGTAIPLFSLRSKNSFGIGEFLDLKKMVDWLKATNQEMLQVLPINDTCMFFDWRDSYPYNVNSNYALHPIYINIKAMGKLSAASQKKYNSIKEKLNDLAVLDYESVIKHKWAFFKELFAQDGKECLQSEEFKLFFRKNSFWLKSYAMYCVLRDEFKTPDFLQWKTYSDFKNIDFAKLEKAKGRLLKFYYFLQFHADKQLRDASEYSRKKGVILKGDIPIGISRRSVEAWTEPQYFNMDCQAGVPPDDFSDMGQNWDFPTYNWDEMRKDGYAWWVKRFKKMTDYFDAYRIDHILGFFRIWEIPLDSIQGLLGYFSPALPYSIDEIEQRGFKMRIPLYLQPYIQSYFLFDLFGEQHEYAYKTFFEPRDYDLLALKPEFDTHRKVEKYFENKKDEQSLVLKQGLFSLINNVLFIEDKYKKNHFHPRISAQKSTVYSELNEEQKQAFDKLYQEFYYERNNEFWKSLAMQKLPALIRATDMLVCGEDLGMIPLSVPYVMNDLQILSLEIQRMPKDVDLDFNDTTNYPYLSVCSTSTHDMSPLRAWWKENKELTQQYYNQILHKEGEAPALCSGKIAEDILRQHLASSAMLVVLPLQDWLAIDENVRRANEDEERINTPAKSSNLWEYRMHISIEQLCKEEILNAKIKEIAQRN